jgi:hypothetical protein
MKVNAERGRGFRTPSSGRLPIKVEFFPDETFDSWTIRLCQTNAISSAELRAWTLHESGLPDYYWVRDEGYRTWRWHNKTHLWLHARALSAISGVGETEIIASLRGKWRYWLSTSTVSIFGALPRNSEGYWHFGSPPEYCPVCVATDAVAYERTVWTSPFAVVCAQHGTLLQEACRECHYPFPCQKGLSWWERGPRRPFAIEEYCQHHPRGAPLGPWAQGDVDELTELAAFLLGMRPHKPAWFPFLGSTWAQALSPLEWEAWLRWLIPAIVNIMEAEEHPGLLLRTDSHALYRIAILKKTIEVIRLIDSNLTMFVSLIAKEKRRNTEWLRHSKEIFHFDLIAVFVELIMEWSTTGIMPAWSVCWRRCAVLFKTLGDDSARLQREVSARGWRRSLDFGSFED